MREMNRADTILDWAAAMNAVHKLLVETMGNKELMGSVKRRQHRSNLTIGRVQFNDISPMKNYDQATTAAKVGPLDCKRKVVKGVRTMWPKQRMSSLQKMEVDFGEVLPAKGRCFEKGGRDPEGTVKEVVLRSGTVGKNAGREVNELQERTKSAIWRRLEEEGKERDYWTKDPPRLQLQFLMEDVEDDLGVERGELIKDESCRHTVCRQLDAFYSNKET